MAHSSGFPSLDSLLQISSVYDPQTVTYCCISLPGLAIDLIYRAMPHHKACLVAGTDFFRGKNSAQISSDSYGKPH